MATICTKEKTQRERWIHGRNAPSGAGLSILERLRLIDRNRTSLQRRLDLVNKKLTRRTPRRERLLYKCQIYDLHRQLTAVSTTRNALYAERDIIIAQFIYLPLCIANKFKTRNSSLDLDDLVGAGQVGLLLGAERYKPNPKASLLSYLYTSIKFRIAREAKQQRSRIIHIPNGAYIREGAEYAEAVTRAISTPISLQARNYNGLLITDVPTRETAQSILCSDDVVALEQYLDRLPERERQVLQWRYWEYRTLQEVGNELGVTRERVRQLEIQAVERLRKWMTPPEEAT